MKPLRILLFLAALTPSLTWAAPADTEPSRANENLNFADAERRAAELRQGMSIESVQALLGKPRRTSLKNNGNSTSPQGTMQWTYSWTATSSPATLRVDFASKTPNAWYVNSWEWANY
jgi:hypothetical protein